MEEWATNFKNDLSKQINEKLKEMHRGQDRSLNEFKESLAEKTQQIEDLAQELQAYNKDLYSKHEKNSKAIKDTQTSNEETVNALGDALRLEMEAMRKKLQRDLKADIDSR
jgi:hypothetical protein